jgi:transposase-like protein
MIRAYFKEAEMGRRARVNRTVEQKLEIVLEGLKSGNIAETCRRYEIAANLYYLYGQLPVLQEES